MNRGRALLESIVDYAGLFPPAAVTMGEAVAEFARQMASERAWMLAAFVVPATRLEELAVQRSEQALARDVAWPLSVLLGTDPIKDLQSMGESLDRNPGAFVVRALEFKPKDVAAVAAVVDASPAGSEVFCELPWTEDIAPWLEALLEAGAKAKIRTGGVTAELFPPVDAVARFLRACVQAGVGLKFTAGLHHPVRARFAMTYEEGAAQTTMHGFLNVFTAAALLARTSIDDATLHAILSEDEPSAFTLLEDGGVQWRDLRIEAEDTRKARSRFARSFGSCSFAEPISDLQTLDLI